jgi:D-serine deaminase-like pyridoxal phosphate-dependent protein
MGTQRWDRFRRALAGEALPAAIVDLDAFEANVDRVADLVRARGRKLRVATKSIRSPALIERVLARGGDVFRGLMTYSAAETAYWARRGQRDLLLAYPTVQPSDLAHLVDANRAGAVAAVIVDAEDQIAALAAAARAAGVTLPAAIEIDMSYRPAGDRLHVGVRRSPLRDVDAIVALAERIAGDGALSFRGLMGYEAQIAGLGDRGVGWKQWPLRALKRRSRRDVAATRARIAAALAARGLSPAVFNGGGTGSLPSSCEEDALTEVTAGSAFLCSHLFDHYADVTFAPAAYFALQVVRRPAPDLVTCHGGGLIASGAAGPDRLPVPALPEGLALLPLEGAGEVQTPLRVPPGVSLAIGDPVLLRHAKAGELAEHFTEYLLVRGDRVEDRAPTYRGEGLCFLG